MIPQKPDWRHVTINALYKPTAKNVIEACRLYQVYCKLLSECREGSNSPQRWHYESLLNLTEKGLIQFRSEWGTLLMAVETKLLTGEDKELYDEAQNALQEWVLISRDNRKEYE
tara:strand:+ start:1492 stop:1833 length:342 start_codon:yes stop_codon:yes gene_type:complete